MSITQEACSEATFTLTTFAETEQDVLIKQGCGDDALRTDLKTRQRLQRQSI
jgi:hypothetical protein